MFHPTRTARKDGNLYFIHFLDVADVYGILYERKNFWLYNMRSPEIYLYLNLMGPLMNPYARNKWTWSSLTCTMSRRTVMNLGLSLRQFRLHFSTLTLFIAVFLQRPALVASDPVVGESSFTGELKKIPVCFPYSQQWQIALWSQLIDPMPSKGRCLPLNQSRTLRYSG